MHLRLYHLLLLLLPATLLSAQDSLLTELLKPLKYNLQMQEGLLTGPGADFLMKEGQSAQFFLIGEDHGIAELPLFTTALFRSFQKLDYRYFATETGPYTASFLQKTLSGSDGKAQFGAFLKELPFSIPFYNLKEEAEMLSAVLSNRNTDEPLIWGLDQEFAGSPRIHLKQLLKEAPNEAARELVNDYYQRAVTGFEEAIKTKNPGASFMAFAKPEDFAKLKAAFKEQPQALERIAALEESINIYQLWFVNQGYESNRRRAEMMKRYFWDYYEAAKKNTAKPKVIFKFGANHMYRGANGLNVFDIGNFVSELASQERTGSFHVYVLAQSGTQNRFTPFSSDQDKNKAVAPPEYFHPIDFDALLSGSSQNEWSILDLRPLRHELFSKRLKGLPAELEKLIWSYDALLVMPEVHASTSW